MSDDRYASRARPSVPMMSRLDRLDSMMKYIEGRQSSSRCGSSTSSSSNWSEGTDQKLQSMRMMMMMPLDTAMKEIQIKGSLLDRVASLENRLFQLCLEVEGLSKSSSSSMAHKYENAPLTHAVPSSSATDIGSSSSTLGLDDQALAAFDAHHYCSFHQALAERFNFLRNTMDNNSTTQLRHLLAESSSREGGQSSNTEKQNKKKLKATRSSRRWRSLLGC